ncbi:MAG: hypothetical protein ACYCWW_07140 [Deltaproteobacteria bacterium]
MAALRRLLWTFVALAVLGLCLGGFYYLRLASALPDLDTSSEVLELVGRSVDALRERLHHETGVEPAPFSVAPDVVLPSPAGELFLSLLRCPDYLGSAGEVGAVGYYREALAQSPSGADRCAAQMAQELSTRLLLPTHAHEVIAGARILSALGGKGLLSVWLSAHPFEPGGPVGVESASARLFHAPAQALDWERGSELVIASEYWDVVAYCKNPPYLKELRDRFLHRAAELIPASAAAIDAAVNQPTSCEQPRTAKK